MALTRAQLLSGNSSQGTVLPGQVQAVSQGAGVAIAANGQISVDAATTTGLVKLNNLSAYNAYVWPNADGALGQQLATDGSGNLSWTDPDSIAWTAKGELVVGTGVNAETLLSVGVDGSILIADSSTASGLAYTSDYVASGGLGIDVTSKVARAYTLTASLPPTVGSGPNEAIDGSLYWDDNLGALFIYYNDGTSSQWVQALA